MNTQSVLLTIMGAVLSLILAIVLIRYSKKVIAKAASRRHILHTLKAGSKSAPELADVAKESDSPLISHKLVPVMLVKLLEEGLVQRANSNKYVLTTKGMESLTDIESASKEFEKVAKIVQKTSRISKFMLNEVLDRFSMISGMDADYPKDMESAIPTYGSDK